MSLDILLTRCDAVMRPESGSKAEADKRYRVYYGENGVPVSVRDLLPFYEKSFTDEAGYEVLERYHLVFDFEVAGLMAEVTRKWTDAEFSGEYSYGFLELHQLDEKAREALLRLMRSGKLEEMRAIVLEAAREALGKVAQMTDLPSDAFQQADSLEKLEEEIYQLFEQATARVRQE
jgi:hypothetical protein